MSGLMLNGCLIANLNKLADVPHALTKFILTHWAKARLGTPHHYHASTIKKALSNQKVSLDYEQVMRSVEFMFITSQKESLTQKQLSIFLKENTLLSDEVTELLLESYQSYSGSKVKTAIGSGLKDMEWSVMNLRQTTEGTKPNKLYVKVSLTGNGNVKPHCLTMTLLEFRLWSEQIRRVSSYLQ